jgi:hypothetical protein
MPAPSVLALLDINHLMKELQGFIYTADFLVDFHLMSHFKGSFTLATFVGNNTSDKCLYLPWPPWATRQIGLFLFTRVSLSHALLPALSHAIFANVNTA